MSISRRPNDSTVGVSMKSGHTSGDYETITQYKVSSQLYALMKKSYIAQKRQKWTNLCQILFPLVLIVLLFLLQLLVDKLIRDEYGGKYRDAIGTPIPLQQAFVKGSSCTNHPVSLNPLYNRVIATGSDLAKLGDFPDFTDMSGGSELFGAAMPKSSATEMPGASLIRSVKFDYDIYVGEVCNPYVNSMNPTLVTKPTASEFRSTIYDEYQVPGGQYLAGYEFSEVNAAEPAPKLKFVAYHNKTLSDSHDLPAVLNLVVNAFYRKLRGKENDDSVFFMNTAVTQMPEPQREVSFDIISVAGPFIYLYVFQLLLPVFMSNQVNEKEHKLRDIMKMMGLRPQIYWFVTYIFNYVMYLVATIIVIGVAAALGFRVFTENVFISYFALFFIWGHVLVALGWVFSVFFTSGTTATVVGYLYVFVTGILAQTLIQNFFENSDTSHGALIGIQVLPTFAFYRGLWALRDGVALGQPGYTLANLKETDWVPLQEVYIVLLIEWACLVLLAIYLEYLFPSGGVGKSCCFCFVRGESPCLSDNAEEEQAREAELLHLNGSGKVQVFPNPEEYALPEDAWFPDDVIAAREQARNDTNAPVRILDLVKVFPSRDGGYFRAVNNLSMTVNKAECFGFLGPNGAGKSTTMNMLCGYLAPDAGTAILAGHDIRKNLEPVHLIMGVCPQENVLWFDLTAGEHLEFYGRLKGLEGDVLERAIVRGLEEVQLLEVRHKKCGEYSGGMKRRLCVAIALIGNPQIILLDEPTNGLDASARRSLWSVIRRAKKRAAVLLTTHSMEEAEELCDRLAVFQDGQLTVVGSCANLKKRFVKGLRLSITIDDLSKEHAVQEFVKAAYPEARLLASLGGVINFELPKETTKMSEVFTWMRANKKRLTVIDWALSNTTLEEAFIYIANGDYMREVNAQREAAQGKPLDFTVKEQ